jgi:hypothetical protein
MATTEQPPPAPEAPSIPPLPDDFTPYGLGISEPTATGSRYWELSAHLASSQRPAAVLARLSYANISEEEEAIQAAGEASWNNSAPLARLRQLLADRAQLLADLEQERQKLHVSQECREAYLRNALLEQAVAEEDEKIAAAQKRLRYLTDRRGALALQIQECRSRVEWDAVKARRAKYNELLAAARRQHAALEEAFWDFIRQQAPRVMASREKVSRLSSEALLHSRQLLPDDTVFDPPEEAPPQEAPRVVKVNQRSASLAGNPYAQQNPVSVELQALNPRQPDFSHLAPQPGVELGGPQRG